MRAITNGLRLGTQWLGSVIATVCLLYFLACMALYAAGARHSPARIPSSTYQAPETIRRHYLQVETDGAQTLRKLNPLTFWPVLHREVGHPPSKRDPGLTILTRSARIVSMRYWTHRASNFTRPLSEIAIMIKISQQWTLDQAANTALAESGFANGVVGLESAANHYYGIPADRLRPQESLALIALMKGPGWYDPFCHPERFAKRYAWAVERIGEGGPAWDIAVARARMRAIPCAHR